MHPGRYSATVLPVDEALTAEIVAAESTLRGPSPDSWFDRLDGESGSVEAALGWALEHDQEQGLSLAAALWPYWMARGQGPGGTRLAWPPARSLPMGRADRGEGEGAVRGRHAGLLPEGPRSFAPVPYREPGDRARAPKPAARGGCAHWPRASLAAGWQRPGDAAACASQPRSRSGGGRRAARGDRGRAIDRSDPARGEA